MKNNWKIAATAALAALGLVILPILIGLVAFVLLSPGTTLPILDDDGHRVPGSISEIVHVPLGADDLRQFVLIRGRDRTSPVLLLLHGGPGDAASAHFSHYNRALEDHFVVVNWDQRGAGRSYSESIPPETMTVEQLVSDTHELTRYLTERFSKSKIFLAGHSWGSYLGMRVARRYPEDYFAFVGMGQVSDQQESEARSYAAVLETAQSTGNREAIDALEELGPPVRGRYRGGIAGLGQQRKWVREFGGAAYGRNNLETLWMFARPLLTFREYRVRDKLAYLDAEAFSMSYLEEPLLDDDLSKTAIQLELPIFILQGRHDLQTVFETTETYFEKIRAPRKEFVVFEHSAHLVPYEDPERLLRVFVDRILPLANSGPD